jgi:hypothetical protein
MKKILTAGLMALAIAGVTSVTKAAPVKDMDLDVSGLGQIVYGWSQQTGSNDGMDIGRLRINLAAKPAEHVSAYASIEGTNMTALGGALDQPGDSRVVDMYVDLTYLPQVTARIGQFATPNSYELNTNLYELETIRYSQGVGTFSMRDRGIALIAKPIPEIGVTVWGLNGNGAVSGAFANNNDSALYGAQVDWNAMKDLSFKGWGLMANDSGNIPGADQKQAALGLGGDFKWEGLHLSGEYNTGNAKLAGVKTEATELLGTAAYTIPQTAFQAVARYDRLDNKVAGVKAGRSTVGTLGVNWNFEKNARVQLAREFRKGKSNDNTDLMLSVKF